MRSENLIFNLLVFVLVSVAFIGARHYRAVLSEEKALRFSSSRDDVPIYLPTDKYVRTVTFGFDQLASDIIWFQAINYFGKQLEQDENIPWFRNMCDLVTMLDKKAQHAYEFCSTLLSWVAKDPKSSAKLLSRAIVNNPDYWRNYYLRGFTSWYFLERKDLALKDFKKAAALPGAPEFVTSMASRLMVSENGPQAAIKFLKDVISRTTEEHARKALIEKLKLAYVSRDIRLIKKKVDLFEQKVSRKAKSLEELIEADIFIYVPKDPYGEPYYLNEKGQVLSRQGKKGLEFFGKTAKTGLAKWN
jgi:tetratricopeptide (TPR) repeat protein